MESYEIVIVGAGPAGLKCAEVLAEAGKEVLVLEKNEVIGPKVCAGCLTAKDFTLGISKNIGKSFKEIFVHTPHRTTIMETGETIITTTDRKELGQLMLKQAKRAGAVIKTKIKVSEIKKDSIIANNKEIRFKYLIGADGSSSMVRRSLGLKTKEIDIAIQYIIPKVYKRLELFFDADLFASGFAWILPNKKFTSIGACVDPRYLNAKDLRVNFNKWLKKKKIDVSKARFEAAPINYNYEGYKFKNKYLIGDAAGFASGLTGEGIYFAILSGKEVAEQIINKKYKPKGIEKILRIKSHHEALLKLFEFSKPLSAIEHETLAILLKSKLIDKEVVDIFG
ncbi:MAG: NAD(P)/FAD-dependent oxidoreductase [Candidatus Aenigmarchaeota archaeon]|nr:NAD(P)/FAD-dependent oxidoreductase [Candidatus Aenigmarchaeota archaeon]